MCPLTVFDSSTNTAVQQQLYAIQAFRWATEHNYFGRFLSEQGKKVRAEDTRTGKKNDHDMISMGADNVVTLKRDFATKKGDTINIHLLAPLTGEGVVDDAVLEGNEEDLTYYNQQVVLHDRAHAVKVGRLSKQRTFVDVMGDARELLKEWLANRFDTDIVLALSGIPNSVGTLARNIPTATSRIIFGGQSAADAYATVAGDANLVEATHQFGTKIISAAKRKAMLPGTGFPKIRPIMVNGKRYYVCFAHPYQIADLKEESAWITAQQNALRRGDFTDHPIFTGAEGIWDGVVVHEMEKIETRLGAGGTTATEYFDTTGDAAASGVDIARALFCGAQSVTMAVGKKMELIPENRDYKRKMGISIQFMYGLVKSDFNSVDFATIALDTGITPR